LKLDRKSLLLYAVTDRSRLGEKTLEDAVEEAISGGATMVQLREKDLNQEEFENEAERLKKVTQKYNIPLIINDNIDVALNTDADGIHIGQNDIPVTEARKRLGKNKILGVSAQTVEQAIQAQKDGADYLGVGAVFTTISKADAAEVSLKTLKEICKAVSIPVVAIGGINEKNILELKGTGIDGVAVISAIFSSKDIYSSSKALRKLAEEITTQGGI